MPTRADGAVQSHANPSSAGFGGGVLIQPEVGAIRIGRCFSSI